MVRRIRYDEKAFDVIPQEKLDKELVDKDRFFFYIMNIKERLIT